MPCSPCFPSLFSIHLAHLLHPCACPWPYPTSSPRLHTTTRTAPSSLRPPRPPHPSIRGRDSPFTSPASRRRNHSTGRTLARPLTQEASTRALTELHGVELKPDTRALIAPHHLCAPRATGAACGSLTTTSARRGLCDRTGASRMSSVQWSGSPRRVRAEGPTPWAVVRSSPSRKASRRE